MNFKFERREKIYIQITIINDLNARHQKRRTEKHFGRSESKELLDMPKYILILMNLYYNMAKYLNIVSQIFYSI